MCPPKKKDMQEPTRSTAQPTLSGNYIIDAGNGTKSMMISGELYFPYVGSPDNPIARDNTGLANTIDGLNEFFKLRWMLVRYRDYTMTRKSKMNVPTTVQNLSPSVHTLYKELSSKLRKKIGVLYDEVKLIVHDYDMDDHWYCRVNNFSSSQSDEKYIGVMYTIDLECYRPDDGQKALEVTQVKKQTNELVDTTNSALQQLNFSEVFSTIQAEIGYNSDFVSNSISIENIIEEISTENQAIQSGQSTALTSLPTLVSNLMIALDASFSGFLSIFLSSDQQTSYIAGTLTLDEVLDINLVSFYNTLQKIKLYAESINGILNSIVKQDEIRYASNADNYTLTTEQFDSINENKVEGSITFYYYTVRDGDTSRIIAARELNDGEKFVNILQVNDINENDFIDGTLVGKQIKIPLLTSLISRGDDNLVYEPNQADIQKFLYGSDIAVDSENKIMISSTGDILEISGIDNVMEGITKRTENKKGSLNVFNPNWGVTLIGDGNSPLLVKIDRYLSDLINQIQSDPRVDSVKMDMSKLKLNGEVLSSQFTIYFVGSEENREVTV